MLLPAPPSLALQLKWLSTHECRGRNNTIVGYTDIFVLESSWHFPWEEGAGVTVFMLLIKMKGRSDHR